MQKAPVNGTEIAYRVDGDGSHPWLVLSNSLATDHRMWEPQMDALTQTHRVLRYDTRGHGQSHPTSGPYSCPMLVNDVVGLLDVLSIEAADVMGLSLGGMTAIGLALDHPGRVSRLICCDARSDAPTAYVDGWHQRIEIVRQAGISAIVDGTLERWYTKAFSDDPSNAGVLKLSRDMIESTSADGFCGCALALTKLAYKPKLKDINVPTLCLVGKEDSAAPPNVMAEMAQDIPGAEFVIIDSAAHLANLNNTADFNRALLEWL